MRFILLSILLVIPSLVSAQCSIISPCGDPASFAPSIVSPGSLYAPNVVPVLPPFGPALPIPRGELNSAGWNTGYSVVTTERSGVDWLRRSIGDPTARYETSVTTILPNDAFGQPLQGPSFQFLP